MSLADLTNRFNTLINVSTCLKKEVTYRSFRNNFSAYGDDINKRHLSEIIIDLHEKDFKFTNKHFDRFIKNAC